MVKKPDATLAALREQVAVIERRRICLEARDNLLTYTKFTMPDPEAPNDLTRSRYKAAKFHELVAHHLEQVVSGEVPQLIFCMPPRHGKTELATKRLAAQYSGKFPHHNIAVGSYSDTMAQDMGADTRAILATPQHKQVFPSYRLRRGGNAKDNIQTEEGGRLVFVGRGGALTGRGAHCFVAGTPVMTPDGNRFIEDLRPGEKVIAFENGEFVARSVEAVSSRESARIFRVTTTAGRVVEATGDHPFHVGGRWVEASQLTPGDRLLCAGSQESTFFTRESDAVLSVVDTGKHAAVYDLQVASAHCFFAAGILVHNCLLIDDLFKDHEEARSPTIRDQAWNWFTKVAMTRRMGRKLVIITMTRWHSDDIIGRLTDPENPCYNAIEAKKWKIIRLPAIAEDDDPLGREVGVPLWPDGPDRFDLDFLESQQRLDPLGFSALYQQSPTVADGTLFRRENIVRYDPKDLPENLRFYCASDHAVGEKQRNDPSCFGKAGVDLHDNLWFTELFWKRIPTDQAVEAMLTMGAQGSDKPLLWWAERGHISKSIGPFLKKRMLETQRYMNVVEVTPIGDKVTRAQSFAARFALGKVYLPKGMIWDKAVEELLAFPNGLHDDFVDMCSLFGLGLRNQFGKSAAPKPVERPKFGTLAWVKENDMWQAQMKREAQFGGF